MSGQMNNSMGNQQPMQQFTGMVQADSTPTMFAGMPQMVVVASPTGAGGMQYGMAQMATPNGAMQVMCPQMQFISTNGQDMAFAVPQGGGASPHQGGSGGGAGGCPGGGGGQEVSGAHNGASGTGVVQDS